MNRTRMLVLAFAALALSVVVSVAVYRVLKNRLSPSDEHIELVVAAEKLPLGSRLTAEKLRTVSWPKGVPLEGSFKSALEVEGRGVVVPMAPNEPILESKLAPKQAGAGLMA